MERRLAWRRAKRILCVRLDYMGDVLMTSPALRALKESGPDRHLTLLTSASGAAAAAMLPEVDEVIVFDAPWVKASAPADPSTTYVMADNLNAMHFDAAVIFTVFSQNPLPAAFLCYLARIPLRLAHCHENPYQLLTDWVQDKEPSDYILHEARRQLALVRHVGCVPGREELAVHVPETARLSAARFLADLNLDEDEPWAVIHPGATAASRRYPAGHFSVVASQLARDEGWRIIFSGGPDDVELVESIRARMTAPSYSAAGQLRLDEMAGMLERAPLLISNNTGPVHLAAALGTPVVDIYALTNPQHTPWKVPNRILFHDVPCRNCFKSVCPEGHHNCLRLLEPRTVVAAALDLYRETQGDGAHTDTSTDKREVHI